MSAALPFIASHQTVGLRLNCLAVTKARNGGDMDILQLVLNHHGNVRVTVLTDPSDYPHRIDETVALTPVASAASDYKLGRDTSLYSRGYALFGYEYL